MRRPLEILLAAVLAGGAILAASYLVAKELAARHWMDPGDDLEWLRREFRLGATELDRIRQLHEGYLPECARWCEQIAARQAELQVALQSATNLTQAVQEKLAEVGNLRAQCQAQMLRHFFAVSQAMPPEQGRRYLAEMQRLTLGHHERFERSMAGSAHAEHAHH
ncbi:MAG: periplasmic heavy metal sensor [Verrucomicrobia bacterium]|nr:periplasmic heavy metal sensor [Verrucomicrobiota bacterium]